MKIRFLNEKNYSKTDCGFACSGQPTFRGAGVGRLQHNFALNAPFSLSQLHWAKGTIIGTRIPEITTDLNGSGFHLRHLEVYGFNMRFELINFFTAEFRGVHTGFRRVLLVFRSFATSCGWRSSMIKI